ncbi:tetratricopeptide repeat protein [Halochromatium roseum]|uniref:tetratricopeptide repeat protein n=1 Tax=Halochromatium roseum TaxID=391920 RepID=UPI0019131783|nr:tetratricopeptide repeat protein [Halochromatium roseum]MBK5941172.1 hypothetical protein [Halochromatium roseum]
MSKRRGSRGQRPPSGNPRTPGQPSGQVAALYQTALQHHRRGERGRAAELYQRILKRSPQHADALHRLGIAAHQGGDQDTALWLIERAIGIRPKVAT